MIDAEKILKNVRELSERDKRNVFCGGKMLDEVCEYEYGNLTREVLHKCLSLYIKQGCMNGRRTYQAALGLKAMSNNINKVNEKFVYSVAKFFDYMETQTIDYNSDTLKEHIFRKLMIFKPSEVKINIKEFITDLNNLFDESELKLAPKDTTVRKWFEVFCLGAIEDNLSENEIYRLEQELNGVDEIEPMTIDVDKLNMEVPECLKN